MDDPSIVPDLYNLAKVAAAIQVKPEHWTGELPSWCDGTHPSATTRPRLAARSPGPSAPSADAAIENATPSTATVLLSRLRAYLAQIRNP